MKEGEREVDFQQTYHITADGNADREAIIEDCKKGEFFMSFLRKVDSEREKPVFKPKIESTFIFQKISE